MSAFLLVFLATFPFENQTPEEAANDDWLIPVAVLVLVLGLVAAVAVAFRRRWAPAAYVVAAVVGIILLVWALGVSDHSDGKLVLWATAVELAGLGAVTLSRRATQLGGCFFFRGRFRR